MITHRINHTPTNGRVVTFEVCIAKSSDFIQALVMYPADVDLDRHSQDGQDGYPTKRIAEVVSDDGGGTPLRFRDCADAWTSSGIVYEIWEFEADL